MKNNLVINWQYKVYQAECYLHQHSYQQSLCQCL